jgi:hypothetical protein
MTLDDSTLPNAKGVHRLLSAADSLSCLPSREEDLAVDAVQID